MSHDNSFDSEDDDLPELDSVSSSEVSFCCSARVCGVHNYSREQHALRPYLEIVVLIDLWHAVV